MNRFNEMFKMDIFNVDMDGEVLAIRTFTVASDDIMSSVFDLYTSIGMQVIVTRLEV